MASISSLGVGSKLDLSTLLTQLETAESQPLVLLQQRQVSYTSKLSAYGTLQKLAQHAAGGGQEAVRPRAVPGRKGHVERARGADGIGRQHGHGRHLHG